MNRRINITPLRVALIGIAVTAAVLIILVGAAYLRSRAAGNLQEDILEIEDNFSQRKEADLDRITDLEDELTEREAELENLRNAFPEFGEPFDIYQQGQELAFQNQVILLSINRTGTELAETTQGTIQSTGYAIQLEGTVRACIAYIQSLENTGLGSVSPTDINISPPAKSCELSAIMFSLPENSQ